LIVVIEVPFSYMLVRTILSFTLTMILKIIANSRSFGLRSLRLGSFLGAISLLRLVGFPVIQALKISFRNGKHLIGLLGSLITFILLIIISVVFSLIIVRFLMLLVIIGAHVVLKAYQVLSDIVGGGKAM
jgi:hypothetical protein